MNILKALSANERELNRFRRIVEQINALEPAMKKLSNEQLRAKTDEFRARLVIDDPEGHLSEEERERVLRDRMNEILPEAFAVVREASVRTLGLRHFDVQLIGGIVLHQGRIAEMKTGEGKTLVATLPLYLNALTGRGAHLVTVNDYLSRRDARWNGPIFHLLGLSVGSIHGQSAETGDVGRSFIYDPDYKAQNENEWDQLRPCSRKEAYACDITYGTNHEFGFDYLRDNMAFRKEDLVQRELNYAIVDEVDSILIDEARTPLIISGYGYRSSDMYYKMDRVVRRLQPERDYTVDEKAKTAMLTDEGIAKVEELTGCGDLSAPDNLEIMQYVNAALKAHTVFKKDIDYVVRDGQVIIVDEFTGRLMFGRRWSDGLHQAVEAKEGVKVEEENQTLATITYQNFFRLYRKLAGMTGTAKTEEDEFRKIYGLDVVEIPTHRLCIRKDMSDVIYKTQEAKFRGITLEVLKSYVRMQPVLVGTRSIEVSERISERLLSERLQLLGAIELLRTRLDQFKDIPNDEKNEYHALLNSKFEDLTINRLGRLAKRLNFDLDMLKPENISELARALGIRPKAERRLAKALRDGIIHNVLNAKYHEMEAHIIAQAGRLGAVTIATNMAGRGVDIILGGAPLPGEKAEDEQSESPHGNIPDDEYVPFDPAEDLTWDFEEWKQRNPDKFAEAKPEALEVIMRGGLYIVGSERHESRRIDNQLRGRAGRQGDPGCSRFFVSLEDELWRLFGDKSKSFLLAGWREDQALDAKLLSRMIERAQKKVEMHHFEMRKHVLEYDDVMNVQRETVYGMRRKILEGVNLRPTVIDYLQKTMVQAINIFCPDGVHPSEWDTDGLFRHVNEILPLELFARPADLKSKKREELEDFLYDIVEQSYQAKEQEIGVELMRDIERHVALDLINRKWIDHLDAMDYLREGIGLRGYAQRDPLIEYKKEAYELFQSTMQSIQDEMVRIMYRVQAQHEPPRRRRPTYENLVELSAEGPAGIGDGNDGGHSFAKRTPVPTHAGRHGKIGRNDPCPCGSGKKFKKCCLGKIEGQF
ncbi:MAG: SEC-C metal-binding domain-containing protein [Armatimonadetes bacterium]|nr:SEC-C metal-binding domain-containing protein [Armatimonadota bacterium]